MALPVVPLPTETVMVGGIAVTIRGLSRLEVVKLKTDYQGKEDAAEVFLLACSLDIPQEEAEAWLKATPPHTAGDLIESIIYLSGLATKGGKSPQ